MSSRLICPKFKSDISQGESEQRFVEYQTYKINDVPLINIAYDALPDVDELYVRDALKDSVPDPKLNLRLCLVVNRLNNPICECCGNKSDVSKLLICKHCCLSWYCNDACSEAHFNVHKLRCCKKDGPLDLGYQQIAMLKVDEKPKN